MFHMGRYDPRADERQKKREVEVKREKAKGRKAPARKKDVSHKKRRRKEHVEHSSSELRTREIASQSSRDARQKITEVDQFDWESSDGEESHSSSSVPSSTDSGSEDFDENEPNLKTRKSLTVIAPEQKPPPSLPKRFGATDEGFDDFDIEEDLVEGIKNEAYPQTDQPESAPVSDEIGTALHMSTLPIKEAAMAWDLAPFLVQNLVEEGFEHFFPIQSLVIPDVIATEQHAHIRARDVCVAAPTGSGKTLAFVLPILNALSKRKIRRLRALVILPSRDLASQVYHVFERYTKGSDLRVGLAIGQSDFAAEQEALTVGSPKLDNADDVDKARHRLSYKRGDIDLALEAFPGIVDVEEPLLSLKGGKSALDVLVATPGRLVDHLDKTPGFTLQHLRFLVIDEADRLVNQSYHNWIGRVVGAANSASIGAWNELGNDRRSIPRFTLPTPEVSPNETEFVIDPITWRRGGSGGDYSEFSTNDTYSSVVKGVCHPVQMRKLLYSATLSKDPQKMASLGLVNARHYDAHHLQSQIRSSVRGSEQRYSMPPGLSEHTVECTAEQKPLVLLALLLDLVDSSRAQSPSTATNIIVVFTSSLDSTHRLVRLLQLLWAGANYGPQESIAEFSSALNQKQRSSLMKRCNASNGGVSVVVCSDGMSRGMDIASVCAVINYDVPSFAKTYVHRCGRTARAGRKGTAISLLKGGQIGQFMKMRRLIGSPGRVSAFGVRKELVRTAVPVYRSGITVLRKVIEAENDGELDNMSPIPSEWIPMV